MTLEESREIIPLMESMIGQIEEQQTLMAEDVYKRQPVLPCLCKRTDSL